MFPCYSNIIFSSLTHLCISVSSTADYKSDSRISIMASAIHSTLPVITTTRVDVSQGKTRSVQDFLRGLKRPGSKARTAKVHLTTGDQDGPPSATVKTYHLPNPLTEDQSTSPRITKTQASDLSALHRRGNSPIKPPESTAPQAFCSSTPAKSAGAMKQPAVTGPSHSLDATKAIRTFDRKRKPALATTEDLPESPPLFCTQSLTANQGLIPRDLEATSAVQAREDLFNHEIENDEQRALRAGTPTVEAVVKEPSKKRRKRRAPVNELALVAELPYTSPPGKKSSKQGSVKRKSPNEANVGKPMGKLSRELIIPRCNSIDPQDFKFPPVTPKFVRSSGWTPGSGFEGTTLQSLGPTTLTSHRRPARRPKAVRFAVPPLRPLDLSTEISPTAKASNSLLLQKAPASLALTPETTCRVRSPNQFQHLSNHHAELLPQIDKTTPASGTRSSRIQIQTASLRPRATVTQFAESRILGDDVTGGRHCPIRRKSPSSQERDIDSPVIRRPSRSERNGWLKRRRRIGFADENEQHIVQSAKKSRQLDNEDGAEQLFEAHNAAWYKKDTQADLCVQESMQGQGWATSIVHPAQTEATRSSQSLGVQNSQGQAEAGSLELGNYPIYPIQDVGLDVGKYFSNAVQNLSSKGKGAHTVVRRKSQIQKLGYGHHSEVEATLELGISPRLKRTLSSVPFRPPFKNM